jgi:uncharacterized protein with ATP-grasp and redox domains
MKTDIECYSCFTKQIISTVKQFWTDENDRQNITQILMEYLAELDPVQSPPEIVTHIHKRCRSLLNVSDPFEKMKFFSNAMVMKWENKLRKSIAESDDPLQSAVRLAIAGNIIDFGLKGDIQPDQVRVCIDQAKYMALDINALEIFRHQSLEAKTILYLADNAGELVFDKLLIEQLSPGKVTLAVKGHPILNDAVYNDAEQVGLTAITRVIDNGSDMLGNVVEKCSKEFRSMFTDADMIISKGQANYETLSDISRDASFLFMLKCPVVSRRLNMPEGSFIIYNKLERFNI